ncbi:prolipoprotein diacylglyceryl transferase [Mycobacterium sp. 236(2023)]|uniref:prolipoprotein diacylglyceryl transferase n=1 Tax=Mycobacterium sp. 236(2023) TaxID=3038163 RepID=UPI0024153FDA|nr:prolipoprotein diacylglyceryl transferase [Mycobacterium sp. 236(2023)]MDG4668825.1 prolipoprotein diacylglyceryl transferase [Mycobacterium sp. 236(2023)]
MTSTVLAYIPSPSQGVWHLGPFPLRAYALFIIVGIVAALVLGDRRWTARGGEPGVIYDVALWAVPFGLVGGRLYHVLTDWPTYFGENGVGPGAALRIWDGGLGIWGAVALGGVGAWIACRRRGIPLPAFGDAIAPGIVLAQAIGRLGNYFNQELYGRETTVPWGLEIYERRNANGVLDSLNGVSTGELVQVVHPTFLYELLWNLLVFAVLILVDRRFKIGHGRLFALYVAGYCVGRFWIELMRSDTATLLAGIRVNTFTSTFVFVAAVVYIMVAPKGREAPETLKGNQDAEHDVEELAKDVAMASATGVVAAATVAGRDEHSENEAGGVGAVEGDEATEAIQSASEAHESAVASAEEAATLAALLEVADEEVTDDEPAVIDEDADVPPTPTEPGGLGAVEGDEAVEAAEGAPAAHDAVTGDDETQADEAEGLGAVEGDEVAVAVGDAPEVHEAAVEGEAAAEELAAEVEAEPEVDDDESVEPESDEAAADDAAGDESDAAEGLGAVEGDEVAEAVEAAPEVHETAVEGTADAEELVAGVEAEPAVDGDESVEPESDEAAAEDAAVDESDAEGLGAVEGDEVAEAVEDAPEVHEAAVEGTADAEELAAEVEAEADEEAAAAQPDAEVEETAAEVEPESDEAEEPEPESAAVDETEVDEAVVDETEAAVGLGAVEGDEVAEAVEAAPEVHEAAVEGTADAEELAAEVEAEPEVGDDESVEPESDEATTDDGVVDEAGAEADAPQDDVDMSYADEADDEPTPAPESRSSATESAQGGVVRRFLRRRRNR